jgi:hypothetical protein
MLRDVRAKSGRRHYEQSGLTAPSQPYDPFEVCWISKSLTDSLPLTARLQTPQTIIGDAINDKERVLWFKSQNNAHVQDIQNADHRCLATTNRCTEYVHKNTPCDVNCTHISQQLQPQNIRDINIKFWIKIPKFYGSSNISTRNP